MELVVRAWLEDVFIAMVEVLSAMRGTRSLR